MDQNQEQPPLCHRCSAELTPGEGNFYVVRIEAYADPTPPQFTRDDLQRDVHGELRYMIEQTRNRSEQELIDDVYRRLTIHLCGACYRQWIEDPTA